MSFVRPLSGAMILRTLAVAAIAVAMMCVSVSAADAAPTISVDDISVTEPDTGQKVNGTFTLTLSESSTTSVKVNVVPANGTATTADYNTQATTTVTFPAGTVTKNVVVSVRGDMIREPDETVLLKLSSPVGATIADAEGVMTILDDDPLPTVTIDDVTHNNEGAVGAKSYARFIIKLSNPSTQSVSFELDTMDGTATRHDYNQRLDVPLTIHAGSTSKYLDVAVRGDDLDEYNEQFYLLVSKAVNGVVGDDNTGEATIVDDDAPPALRIGDINVSEPYSERVLARVPITLAKPSAKDVYVKFSTIDGTATGLPGGLDFIHRTAVQARILAGRTSTTADVWVRSDKVGEAAETFSIVLGDAQEATIVDGTGVVTILAHCHDYESNTSGAALDLGTVRGDTGSDRLDYDGWICEGDTDWLKFTMSEADFSASQIDLTADTYLTGHTSDLDLFGVDPTNSVWMGNPDYDYVKGQFGSTYSGTANENVYFWKEENPAAGAGDTITVFLKVATDPSYDEPQTGPYRISIIGNA